MTEKRIKVLVALNTITQGNPTNKVGTYEIAQYAKMSVLATHNILMAMSQGEGTHYVRRCNISNASVSGGAYKYGWMIRFEGYKIAKNAVK